MRKEKTQINKIRNERVEITTNTKEIKGIIRDDFENLHLNKLQNLEKFLATYNQQTLNQEDINCLNSFRRSNKIKAAIKSLPPKRKKFRT
jgi:hypothetical protein